MLEDEESDDNQHEHNCKKTVGVCTETLIELVKNKPALWDRNCKEYRYSKHKRVKFWAEICEEMYPDFKDLSKTKKYDMVQKLQKKWYNTRDSYRKSLRRGKPYLFAKLMTFLDSAEHFEKRVDNDEDTINFTFEGKSDDEDYTQEVYFDTEENKIVDKDKHSKNKRLGIYLEAEDVDVSPSKVLKTSLSSQDHSYAPNQSTFHDSFLPVLTSMIQREDDEDRGFFNSLLPCVKKLTPSDKIEFKIRVMTTLKELLVKKEKDPIDSDEF